MPGGGPEGQQLGVGRRVLGGFPLVGGGGEYFLTSDYHGPNGYLSPLCSPFGSLESAAHHSQVSFAVGMKGFEVFGHDADDSSDDLLGGALCK